MLTKADSKRFCYALGDISFYYCPNTCDTATDPS
jgi:hypothetical protein